MKAYFTIEIRDREGKLIRRLLRRSRSYVQQWNELVRVGMAESGTSIKDIGGTARTISPIYNCQKGKGAAGDDTKGVVIGRGSTAVAIDDYVMETICAEGTGANQVNYQATTISAVTVAAPDSSFTMTRSAINNSGSTITITEIGIYVMAQEGGAAQRKFLGVRDILSSSQDVPDGGAITVVYMIKVTV